MKLEDRYFLWETKHDVAISVDQQWLALWSFLFPDEPEPTVELPGMAELNIQMLCHVC